MARDHTIPCFYLSRFACELGRRPRLNKVYVYEKSKKPWKSSVESIGYECGYFRYYLPDGSVTEAFEGRLADLEDQCNSILAYSASPIFDLDALSGRVFLSFYMGMLFARSTSRRKMSVENWEKLKAPFLEVAQNEEYVRDAAIRFSNKTETVVTTDYVREVMRAQADKFSTKETTSNAFIANLIDHANIMVNSLVPRRWQIWEAPAEAEFVTSDNPVITFIPIGPNLWHPGYGFNTPNVVAAFPLAPTACLVVASDNMLGNPAALQIHEIGDQQHKIVDASTVSRINELVISCSDRFVYAKNCDANIEQAVNDIGHTTVPLVNAFLHPFPGARQIEEHLRKTIGIPRQADAA